MPRLPPEPALQWKDGAPRTLAFDDVYFSRDGGLAESDVVFIGGCGLPDAWRTRDQFTICELGFGCGLNVIAAWRAWKDTHRPHAVLHICSIEAFPLAREDAARALAPFAEVGEIAAKLLAHWPVRAYAPQRVWFEEDRVALTLFTGEAETILAGLEARVDAWFLDGFAPARNPTMWSGEVFRQIARLSAPDARLATYSVAGGVRRELAANGFTFEKKPGFAAKRERLEARNTAAVAAATQARQRVAVIGAGIAGAACAQALARRGVETVVLEAALELGAGASGNPAGLVMPRLDRGGALSEVFLASSLAAVAAYEALGVYTRCGVEERAEDRRAEALADLIADPPLPADWFSRLADGAALHARAGLVRPREAIAAMLSGAQVLFEAPVAAIERAGDGWLLRAPDGRTMLKADAIVLACGAALTQFAPAKFLPIELSRGQIEWGPGSAPAHALTRGSYVAPYDGGVLFGATFDKVDAFAPPEADASSRARNLEALAQLAPEIAASIDAAKLNSRAALRAATPDRAPIAGALPDAEAWLEANADVAHGAVPHTSAHIPGVYVIGGLGARGLTLAPLLGEEIAAEICGEPQVLSAKARAAIDPARFLQRALKRR